VSSLALLAPAAFAVGVGALRFGNRRSRATAAGPVLRPVMIDPSFGDDELAALRAAVVAADWPAAEAILRPCRERGDHARLTWLISGVENIAGNFMPTLPTAQPDNALALTVAGAREVTRAWEARTGARASQVSQEQFQTFHDRLRTAEAHLYAAVEADPESAAPWYFLTTASRGLEHGHEVTRRRFDAGDRRAPGHLAMHAAMLQQVSAKWSGSHEQMHDFARQSLATAAPGSSLGALTASAHIEHWLDLPRTERYGYIRSGEVVAELHRAADASVLHPAFAPTESPCNALNSFAMAFWLAGRHDTAGELFRRIGDRPTRLPWAYAGSPEKVFAEARQECNTSTKRK